MSCCSNSLGQQVVSICTALVTCAILHKKESHYNDPLTSKAARLQHRLSLKSLKYFLIAELGTAMKHILVNKRKITHHACLQIKKEKIDKTTLTPFHPVHKIYGLALY